MAATPQRHVKSAIQQASASQSQKKPDWQRERQDKEQGHALKAAIQPPEHPSQRPPNSQQ
jgi:hypothetical protein